MDSDVVTVSFTWPEGCGDYEPIKLSMKEWQLTERDPQRTSLLAAKLSFANSKSLEMTAVGPTDDEYMSLDLIKFVWNYIKHGELDVPASIDAVDAERALDYWGFSGCVVKIPESDPAFMGKHLSYKIYRAAMDGVPKIVATVKSTLLSQLAGVAGMHLIVDNKKGAHTNQFGDYLDPLLQQYASRGIEQGTVVKRLGDALGDYTIGYTYSNVFKLLGGSENDKTSSAARNKVLTEVLALGGLDVSWENKNTIVADNGEYGMQNFDREKRWVLKIAIAHDDEDSTEGIKRRKVA